MTFHPNNIEQQLSGWGKAKRQVPEKNGALKAQALARLAESSSRSAPLPSQPYRLPWLSLAFTGFAIVSLIVFSSDSSFTLSMPSLPSVQQKSMESATQSVPGSNTAKQKKDYRMPSPMAEDRVMNQKVENYDERAYDYDKQVPSTDTREYLKTDYSASVKTRRVRELAEQVRSITKGLDGRVDGISSSNDTGYISLTIPASRLDSFRSQVKNLAGARFYTETLSSTNMLPDKLNLERQQNGTRTSLDKLNADRDELTQAHNKAVSGIRAELAAANRQLTALQTEVATDPGRAMEIDAQKQQLAARIQTLQGRLARENSSYNSQISYINSQAESLQAKLTSLGSQTTALLDNVATVNANLSFERINLFEWIGTYVPGYWFALFFIALAMWAFLVRRRARLVIPAA